MEDKFKTYLDSVVDEIMHPESSSLIVAKRDDVYVFQHGTKFVHAIPTGDSVHLQFIDAPATSGFDQAQGFPVPGTTPKDVARSIEKMLGFEVV